MGATSGHITNLKQSIWGLSISMARANGREPKSCFGRVFNFKIGCFIICTNHGQYKQGRV